MVTTLQAPTNDIAKYSFNVDIIGSEGSRGPVVTGMDIHLLEGQKIVNTVSKSGEEANKLYTDYTSGKNVNDLLQIQTPNGKLYNMNAQPQKDPMAQAKEIMNSLPPMQDTQLNFNANAPKMADQAQDKPGHNL